MKTIGLDTCVVIRLLVGEPEEQAERAKDFIDKCYHENVLVCVSDMVVAEAYYALIYHYDIPKKECIEVLLEFLSSPLIKTTGHSVSVLMEYKGKGVGFVDQLIRRDYLSEVDHIVTFDTAFSKLENVMIIQ